MKIENIDYTNEHKLKIFSASLLDFVQDAEGFYSPVDWKFHLDFMTVDGLKRYGKNAKPILLQIVEGEEILGCMLGSILSKDFLISKGLKANGKRAEIARIAVDPKFRSRGLSSQLYRKYEEIVLGFDDIEKIIVMCKEENIASVKLQQKMGYTLEVDETLPDGFMTFVKYPI